MKNNNKRSINFENKFKAYLYKGDLKRFAEINSFIDNLKRK